MIKLKEIDNNDIPFILQAENGEDNRIYVLQNTEEEHRSLITDRNIDYFKIVAEWNSQPVGYCIIAGKLNEHKSIELRRLVIVEKGKSYGKMTIRSIIRYCFEDLAAHRLWLDVFENNVVARSLYERMGFMVEARLRESYYKDGEYRTQILMSILESEYEAANRLIN